MRLEKSGIRPVMSDVTLSILVCAYLFLLTNATFWSKGTLYFQDHLSTFVAMGIILVALHLCGMLAVSVKYAVKPIFVFLIMVAAVSSYFTDTMGILITRDMIRNAAVTTTNEAKHLITWRFLVHVALYGLLPSALVVWTRIEHLNFFPKVWQHLKIIVPLLLIAGAAFFFNTAGLASAIRQHRDLLASLNPVAPTAAAVKYVKTTYFSSPVVVAEVGTDAFSDDIEEVVEKKEAPHVFVVVAGETARAKDFSLYGYARETNPVLKAHDNVFVFKDTTSCGTATAVSLPCMFSMYTRSEYSDAKGESTESVLDVLDHSGVKTAWWDANTGSKGVAARTIEIDMAAGDDPRFCVEGECRDDILVDKLQQELPKVTENTVFVLHMIGSHGPAYFMRYKEDGAPFKPDCRSTDFADCTPEEITNAYDNTIAYTDKILGEVIDALEAQGDRINASMLYMSDHGESLGENGLYLHGAPWFMAPAEQTHVPFIMWLSPYFVEEEAIDTACLKADAEAGGFSHDNLFHTLLGAIDVKTELYDAKLDVLAPCRSPETDDLRS
ncbi:MAG: phosphoethanolamine transferase [Rhizobiales bacterium]|nr:phosphoethanolamine transferase [Hyphomicrobiales bacterium]MBG18659.1 phosphoethanolamine transferase [Hyphomicrobiales bacterium]